MSILNPRHGRPAYLGIQDHGTRGNSRYNYPDAWSDRARIVHDAGHILAEFSELNVGARSIAGPAYLARLGTVLHADSDPLDPFNLTDAQLALLQEEAENLLSVEDLNEFMPNPDEEDELNRPDATHIVRPEDLGMSNRRDLSRRRTPLDPEDYTDRDEDLAWRGYSTRCRP